MLQARKIPRDKALWVQIRDAKPKPPVAYEPFEQPCQGIAKQPKKPAYLKRKNIVLRSDFYRAQMAIYFTERVIFLSLPENYHCRVFPHLVATQIHHMRGRGRGGVGPLLLDKRYWLPVSERGHDKIHRNPEWAIAKGFMAAPGEWNKRGPEVIDV